MHVCPIAYNYPTAKIFADGTRVDYTPEYWRAKEKPSSVVRTTQARQPSFPSIRKWKVVNPKEASYESGVYALLIRFESDDEPVIAYIGLSKVLCNRLKGHPVISMLKKQGCIIEIAVLPTKDYIRLEWMLIMHHKPLLNIRDNH